MRIISATHRGDSAALIAGLLLPLAFAPFELFPLALFAPAVLFTVWRGNSPGRAAWRGFLFGLGMYGVGVSWVYVSLHTFGHMPAPLAVMAVTLFVAGLALFPALLGALQARFARHAPVWHHILTVPALWVLFEWLRGWVLGGFPWLLLGYAQTDNPLAGYAPWTGVYGVSFMAALSAGLLATGRLNPKAFWVMYLPILVLMWAGGWAAGQVPWVHPVDKPLRVALVQGNVPLAIKWQPGARDAIIERYLDLSRNAQAVDLVVWPEAAVPGYMDDVSPALWPRLQQLSAEGRGDFVLGVIERFNEGRTTYNSVVTVGSTAEVYRKQHLVPFGEFLPFPRFLGGLIQYLNIPMSNFTSGPVGQQGLRAAGQQIGVSICYEDAYGEEVIRALPAATVLVNVSEDAWFGESLAPHQRVQMARMRALESGRPMLRAANTGPSVVIDPSGQVVAAAPQFEAHVLIATVQPMQGMTPYARTGNLPVVLVCLMIVVVAPGRRRYGSKIAPDTVS